MIGFIESEGTFYCYMSKIEENNQASLDSDKSEYDIVVPKVYNSLEIAQSTHEVPLLKAIINFVEKGYLKPKPKSESLDDMLSLRSVSRIVFNSPPWPAPALRLTIYISRRVRGQRLILLFPF